MEHGLHLGFWQVHDCSDILGRLGRERYWRPRLEVCHELKTYRPQIVRTVGPYRVTS